jgi:hypothetical protein
MGGDGTSLVYRESLGRLGLLSYQRKGKRGDTVEHRQLHLESLAVKWLEEGAMQLELKRGGTVP